MHAGDFRAAAAVNDEADAITHATGGQAYEYTATVLAAWRGREPETLDLIDTMREKAQARREGRGVSSADNATAVLYVGLGRYDRSACLRARRHGLRVDSNGVDRSDRASRRTRTRDRDSRPAHGADPRQRDRLCAWPRGPFSCARDRRCGRGRRALRRSDNPPWRHAHEDPARSCASGLRRVVAARASRDRGSRSATDGERDVHHDGAEAFADRAARELLATGEHVRPRSPATSWELTRQEARVAELAGDGASNPEIAAQLYISPRTVEYHLHKVFNSRHQLAGALERSPT